MAPEVDSDDENVEYEDDNGHRYRLYLDELEDGSTAPTSNSTAPLQGEFGLTRETLCRSLELLINSPQTCDL